MSIEAIMTIAFQTNEDVAEFGELLENNGLTNHTYFSNLLEVTVYAHGDRCLILSEARDRGARILKDEVFDEDD